MPRRLKEPSPRTAKYEELIERLVQEMRAPKETGQPLILEERQELTDALQIYIIWDLFDGCPESQRSEIVLEAYRRCAEPSDNDHITLALGMTFPEAAAVGMLPFKVVSVRHDQDGVQVDEYRRAMIEEGASTLREPPELRFASVNEAVEAQERLQRRLPNSKWAIVQEVVA